MTTEVVPSASEVIRDMTSYSLLPLWMDNLARNLQAIRDGLDAYDLPRYSGPALILGAGPSVHVYKHLNLIKRAGWTHAVFCCDKLLGEVLHMGIKPSYVATVDGNPTVNNFFTRKDVKKHAKDITGVFNVLTHPSVIETWNAAGAKPWWFVSQMDTPDERGKLEHDSLTAILYELSNHKGIISGVGNVGSFLWNLSATLGYSPLILVGFDFSEQVPNKADAVYFEFYTRWFLQKFKDAAYAGLAQDRAADMHQIEVNPDFTAPFTKPPFYRKGEHPHYLVNPIWKYYRDTLAMHIVSSRVHTINATGNGCIHTEAKNEKGEYILKVPNFEAQNLDEVLKKYG
jgi:hypothetical protein